VALQPKRVERLTALPARARDFLADALSATPTDDTPARRQEAQFEALALVPALAAIVVGSIGMVDAAVAMGTRWHVPENIIGALVLAGLTGIPNAVAAQSLARQGRGATVLSEALNSNSLNIVAGIGLPAVVVGFGAPSTFAMTSWWWLAGATLLTLALLLRGGELRRPEGAVIVVVWAVFAAVTIVNPF
jgi:cation:H+ antiporter